MSSSLEKVAGSGMERILERATTGRGKTGGRFKGWFFGAAITAILQSSAAVTIMVSGFVNAGIMKLGQALPVVFGSNLGSTATAQILRLGDLDTDTLILQLLRPAAIGPILVGIGAFIRLFTKKKKLKDSAGILIGLGMLFYGMTLMEQVFEPFSKDADFRAMFASFENPLLGLLTGLVIAAVIQSSNAAVGILQALSVTGAITYGITIPIVIGINLGKCMHIVFSMLSRDKKAKKVSWGYVLFNVFGALFFMLLIYGLNSFLHFPWLSHVVDRGSVATVHLAFNLVTSLLLLFGTDRMAKICDRLGGKEEENSAAKELAKLDDMLLNTPTIALEQCKDLMMKMTDAILDNYRTATRMIYHYDAEKFPLMEEKEEFLDRCETVLSTYVVRIDQRRLTEDDKRVVSEILNSIGDLERVGDYCMNIAYVAREKNEQSVHFSPYGHREVDTIIGAVEYAMETCFKAFQNDEESLAVRVEPLSETVDKLKELIKSRHVERLQKGICTIQGGVYLFDLINSFERISAHCANVSLHVIKRIRQNRDFDEMHGHANDSFSEEYKAMYHYYTSKYVDPILKPLTEEELAVLTAASVTENMTDEEVEKAEKAKERAAEKAGKAEKKAAERTGKAEKKAAEKKAVEGTEKAEEKTEKEAVKGTEKAEEKTEKEAVEGIEKAENIAETEYHERSGESEKSERSDRAEILGQRMDERAEDVTKPEKAERPENPEKAERPEKPGKAERSERSEKTEKSEKTVKSEKSEKSQKSDKPEKPGKTEKPEKTEKPVKVEKHEKSGKDEKARKNDKAAKTEALAGTEEELKARKDKEKNKEKYKEKYKEKNKKTDKEKDKEKDQGGRPAEKKHADKKMSDKKEERKDDKKSSDKKPGEKKDQEKRNPDKSEKKGKH
ncbi:MAG: Na/Pi symporter [Eubacterium sp.]|nr:Na/Pi symporter [Eubacterium sp.]